MAAAHSPASLRQQPRRAPSAPSRSSPGAASVPVSHAPRARARLGARAPRTAPAYGLSDRRHGGRLPSAAASAPAPAAGAGIPTPVSSFYRCPHRTRRFARRSVLAGHPCRGAASAATARDLGRHDKRRRRPDGAYSERSVPWRWPRTAAATSTATRATASRAAQRVLARHSAAVAISVPHIQAGVNWNALRRGAGHGAAAPRSTPTAHPIHGQQVCPAIGYVSAGRGSDEG